MAAAVVPSTAQATHTAASRKASAQSKKKKTRKTSSRRRGQQKIDAQRALEIQQALIREHYLDGKPSGKWDVASEQAMQKYQADHGWQSKTVPDSRALIQLGLGPDQENLLNPESAMTSKPVPAGRPTASSPDSDKQPRN